MTTRETTTHTPGPWKVAASVDNEFVGIYPATDRAEFPICKMPAYTRAEIVKANARLLSASPDLLEALEAALEFIEDQEDVVDGSYGVPEPNRAMILAAELRSAIVKATGSIAACAEGTKPASGGVNQA